MVDINLIEKLYNDLISILEFESMDNSGILEFSNYVKEKREVIIHNIHLNKLNANKELLRGMNRFSDEFEFSDSNRQPIKTILYQLYDLLNKSN